MLVLRFIIYYQKSTKNCGKLCIYYDKIDIIKENRFIRKQLIFYCILLMLILFNI
jgi:hypothetical protein